MGQFCDICKLINSVFLTVMVLGQSVVVQMMQGPLDMVVGLVAGGLWGLLSGFLPHMEDVSLQKYTIMLS